MGGRGSYARRQLVGRAVNNSAIGGGGGVSSVSPTESSISTGGFTTNVTDVPQIKNFSQKNIVSFSASNNDMRDGTIKIRDDNGKLFTGKFEGAGASRSTYAFKEGFVLKIDRGSYGSQNKQEIKTYQRLKNEQDKAFLIKRTPKMIGFHNDVSIKVAGTSKKVDLLFMSRAVGAHNTGVPANTPKGRNLLKRLNQYTRALKNRGLKDIVAFERNGNVFIHNVYRNKKNGKLTIVDLGI